MSTVPTRQLGRNGPHVPPLGFGAMGLSVAYSTPGADPERFALLDRAFELGLTFWDTADVYGDSEDLLGAWFKRTGKRDSIFLASKFGGSMDTGTWVTDSSAAYCKAACEKSLQRLGVETIDLYYCHRVDSVTPIEHTVAAMAELVKEGKVKYLGLSEISPATLRRAHKIHPITAVEMEYSPFSLDVESTSPSLLETCRELGVGLVAYSPLGRGMLTGRYTSLADFEPTDARLVMPRFSKENFPKNIELVNSLQGIAERNRCTIAQLVLAWLLAQGDDVFPIPGTNKLKYLEENAGGLKVVLGEDEVKEVRALVNEAASKVAGSRQLGDNEIGDMKMFADTVPLE